MKRETVRRSAEWLEQRLRDQGKATAVREVVAVASKKPRLNKTETAYAQLLALRMHAGEITWYDFEGMRLKLADRTYLTVDFPLRLANGAFEMHEIKGGPIEDDAAVKLKVAQKLFPFFRFIVVRREKGGGWSYKDVASGL